jgi:hypothetical protein
MIDQRPPEQQQSKAVASFRFIWFPAADLVEGGLYEAKEGSVDVVVGVGYDFDMPAPAVHGDGIR